MKRSNRLVKRNLAVSVLMAMTCGWGAVLPVYAEDAKETEAITGSEYIDGTREADENGKVTIVRHTNEKGQLYVTAMYDKNKESDAQKNKAMEVDVSGHLLELRPFIRESDSYDIKKTFGTAGINVGTKQYIRIFDSKGKGKLLITSPNEKDGVRQNNGVSVYRDGRIDLDTETEISNLTASQGYTYTSIYGIRVQDNGAVNANENLHISNLGVKKGKDILKGERVHGIVASGKNSRVITNKTLTIDGVQGLSLYANGGKIETKGDVSITACPDQDRLMFYRAVFADNGEININTDEKSKVRITGDVAAQKVFTSTGTPAAFNTVGILRMSLSGKDSFWRGMHNYNFWENMSLGVVNMTYDAGVFDLVLKNGSTWINERQSGLNPQIVGDDKYKGSRVTSLAGGETKEKAGIIVQKEETPITIDGYKGHIVFIYSHDPKNPVYIHGGSVIITKAEAESGIVLRTDAEGLRVDSGEAADKDVVSDTLNALANKIYYMAYKEGETNLKGKVEIAEGLTAQSVSKRLEDITFSKETGQGTYLFTREEEIPAAEEGPIKTPERFTKDRLAKAGEQDAVGNGSKKVVAGVYNSTNRKNMDVDMRGYKMSITADGGTSIVKTAGILGSGSSLRFLRGDDKNPIHITVTGKGQSYGIMTRSSGAVTLLQDVIMDKIEGSQNAYGVYASNPGDSISLKGLTIDGSVTATKDKMNQGAVGIAAIGNGSRITIDRLTDIKIKGVAVHAMGGSIRLGETRIETDTDISKNHRALVADTSLSGNGIISVNMNEDYTKALGERIVIQGDIVTSKKSSSKESGKVFLGLTQPTSLWKGVSGYVNNANEKPGEFHLWLKDKSLWTNEIMGSVDPSWKGSHVTFLQGGEFEDARGGIVQKDLNDITIDRYAGYVTVIYEHDKDNPVKIIGGNTIITKADSGASITLRTSSKGLNMNSKEEKDKKLIDDVLNALANKLYYTAYKDGETNLKGKVEIAESLTASSVTKRIEDISFRKDNGQGEYKFIPPEAKLSYVITGLAGKDKYYTNEGIRKEDGTYRFNKDTAISLPETEENTASLISAEGKITIDAKDHVLSFSIENKKPIAVISQIEDNTPVEITAKEVRIMAKGLNGRVEGIRVGGQGQENKDNPNRQTINGNLFINVSNNQGYLLGTYIAGNTEFTVNGNVIMKGDADTPWGIYYKNDKLNPGLFSTTALYAGSNYTIQKGGRIRINGEVDLKVRANGAFANGGHSHISIAGGKIEIPEKTGVYAFAAASGHVEFNMNEDMTDAGTHKADIKGDIGLLNASVHGDEPDKRTTIHVGLSTEDSIWNGAVVNNFKEKQIKEGWTGQAYIYLKNGATWTHNLYGSNTEEFKGSTLAEFHGGKTANDRGVIIQNNEKPITVENYSGHTLVIYAHDKTDPKKMIGGDFIINKAEKDSMITLRTDNDGMNALSGKKEERNKVSEILNALANKLYYTAYKDGEKNLTGKVEIAEGLTAQSASKRIEDMTFKDANGQGQYLFTPEEDKPPVPGEADGPIKKPEIFTKDRVAKATEKDAFGEGIHKMIAAAYNSTAEEDMTVNMKDSTLTLSAEAGNEKAVGILSDATNMKFIGGKESTPIHISVKGNGMSYGILTSSKGIVDISQDIVLDKVEGGLNAYGVYASAPDDMITLKGLTIHNSLTAKNDTGNQKTIGIAALGKGSKIHVNGKTDISIKGTAVKAAGGTVVLGETVIDIGIDTNKQQKALVAQSTSSGAGIISVNMNADNTSAGDKKVVITGDTLVTKRVRGLESGKIYLGLNTAESMWKGISGYSNSLHVQSGELNLWLANGATWANERTAREFGVPGGWEGSLVTSFHGGKTANARGVIIQNNEKPITVDNYSGHTLVLYKHDKTDPKKMIGGDFIINKAEKDSMITLRTDNEGMNALSGKKEERNKVSEILNALANKLYYTAYKDGETNLKGKVEIAEGLTAQSASYRLEDMTFKKENGQGQYLFTPATEDVPDTPKPGEEPKPPTPDKPNPPVIYGPKQTAMMRGAKSAMTTTMLSMRDNMTTMTQRLGDIHEGTEDGIWARTYGGKANYDKDLTKTKENFWGVQIGADKKQKSGWHTGISFDYKDGNATYELGGKGDPKLYTLGIYGTKTKDNGEYIDVVAKAGRGQNDYTVYNDMGHKLKGDYKANAIGLSVEYGKKIEKDNMYLTPQIQLSYMKLQGTDYDAISDYANGKKMHVKQDGMTSLVGRIGIAAGKRTDKTDLYLKANLLHEFKGTTASTFSAENEPTGKVDQDFGDTWAELIVGINHNIDKDKMIYADITKSFGGDYEMEWKANAGIRLRF